MKITANLIKYGLVDIEEIWPHLNPLDSEIEALFQKKITLASSVLKNVLTPKTDNQKKDKEAEQQKLIDIKSQMLCKPIYIICHIDLVNIN